MEHRLGERCSTTGSRCDGQSVRKEGSSHRWSERENLRELDRRVGAESLQRGGLLEDCRSQADVLARPGQRRKVSVTF